MGENTIGKILAKLKDYFRSGTKNAKKRPGFF